MRVLDPSAASAVTEQLLLSEVTPLNESALGMSSRATTGYLLDVGLGFAILPA